MIVVDDQSTDATASILQHYARQDTRVRHLTNPRQGLVSAINLAVRHCRGTYIARMDGDDRSYPNRLTAQLQAARENRWDIVGGLVRIVDRQGIPVPSYQRYEKWINRHRTNASIRAYRFVESPLANPTTCSHRRVYDSEILDGPFPEDYDFWLTAISRGFRCGKVSEVVLDWMDSPTRTTRNHPRYSPEAFDHCRRKHLLSGPLKGKPTVDLWGVGLTGKPWLRWLQQEGFAIRQLIDVSPKKVGQSIHGVRVVSPEQLLPPDDTPLLVAVGAASAREEIEAFLRQRHYRIGEQVWFVA